MTYNMTYKKRKTKQRTQKETNNRIAFYLKLPYARMCWPDTSFDHGRSWLATIAEFRGVIARGPSPAEALMNVEIAAEAWLAARMALNQPIPLPSSVEFMYKMGHFI